VVDVGDLNHIFALGCTSNVVRFSPDDTMVAAISDDGVAQLFEIATRKKVAFMNLCTVRVRDIVFNVDGKFLAVSSRGSFIQLWHWESGKVTTYSKRGLSETSTVAFSPDGKYLIAASRGARGAVRLWDLESDRCIAAHINDSYLPLDRVWMEQDGTLRTAGVDGKRIVVWNVSRKPCAAQRLQTHTGMVFSLAFSPDGKRLASSSQDQTIRVWDVNSGQCIVTLAERASVRCISFSHDGRYLASGSGGFVASPIPTSSGSVRIWDTESAKCIASWDRDHTLRPVRCVIFRPADDGELILAVGSDDHDVYLWTLDQVKQAGHSDADRDEYKILALKGHTDGVNCIGFSKDGTRLVSGSSDNDIRVWSLSNDVKCVTTFQGHETPVTCVGFTQDDRHVASCSVDGTIRFWRLESGICMATLMPPPVPVRSTNISPDGRFLASCVVDSKVQLWDITGCHVYKGQPQSPKGVVEGHGIVDVLQFSPDGRYLAMCTQDQVIYIWRIEDLSSAPELHYVVGLVPRTQLRHAKLGQARLSPDLLLTWQKQNANL